MKRALLLTAAVAALVAALTLPSACASTPTPTVGADPDRYEPNDTRQQATFMQDLSIEAYISHPNDVDVFMTPATYGGYLLAFTVELYDLPADYDLYVHDSAGREVARSTNRGLAPEFVYYQRNSQSGSSSYWLDIVGADGAYDPSQPYRLRFTMNPDNTPPALVVTPTATPMTRPTVPAQITATRTPTPRPESTSPILLSAFHDGAWGLYARNADGSEIPLDESEVTVLRRSWSPDGEHIVFSAAYAGTYWANLYVINANKSGLVQLTDHTSNDRAPAWSPDGERIAFVSVRDGRTGIYAMAPDGNDVIKLADKGEIEYPPRWSPDGTRLTFMHFEDNYEVYVLDVAARGLTQLTTTRWTMDEPPPYGPWSVEPAWSPDGTQIVFSSVRDTNTTQQIYVVGVDGSGLRQLTVEGGAHPAWSPDGKKIAFTLFREGRTGVYLVDVDDTTVSQLASFSPYVQDYAWSPDSASLVLVTRDGTELDLYRVTTDNSTPPLLLDTELDHWKPLWAH